jgi:hypothetical protein
MICVFFAFGYFFLFLSLIVLEKFTFLGRGTELPINAIIYFRVLAAMGRI